MSNFIFILLSFLVAAGCQGNVSYIDPIKTEFENISFDVVQKQLVIKPELPRQFWFNNQLLLHHIERYIFKFSFYRVDIRYISLTTCRY